MHKAWMPENRLSIETHRNSRCVVIQFDNEYENDDPRLIEVGEIWMTRQQAISLYDRLANRLHKLAILDEAGDVV